MIPPPDGIGDGMTPDPPESGRLLYGIVNVNSTVSQNITWQYFSEAPYASPGTPLVQQYSAEISGQFYVYREFGHGLDSYLVVYTEQGLVSPGKLLSDQALTAADRSAFSRDLAKGFFQTKIEPFVMPSIPGAWLHSSPTTVNQSANVTDQTVDTFEISTSFGVSADEKGGGANSEISQSHSTQIWHGVSFKISDWNIDEVTDARTNRCAWTYWQFRPWDVSTRSPGNFGSWWADAFNMGGGWDDVKDVPDLSKSTLQYHNTAAWRFEHSLVDSQGQLNVAFTGGADYTLYGINMPQLQNNGHHQLWSNVIHNRWSKTIDLAAIVFRK